MSLRDAINAKCRECIVDIAAGAGTWRQQVEACTDRACSLYPVRPLSRTKADSASGNQQMSLWDEAKTAESRPVEARKRARGISAGGPVKESKTGRRLQPNRRTRRERCER
jgi:hypothetical protein